MTEDQIWEQAQAKWALYTALCVTANHLAEERDWDMWNEIRERKNVIGEEYESLIDQWRAAINVTVSERQPDAESVTADDDFLPPWLNFDDVCEGTDGIDDSGLNEVPAIPAPLYHGQYTRWNMHKLKSHYYSYLFGKLWFSLDGKNRLEETRPVTVTNWRQQIVDDEIRKDESA